MKKVNTAGIGVGCEIALTAPKLAKLKNAGSNPASSTTKGELTALPIFTDEQLFAFLKKVAEKHNFRIPAWEVGDFISEGWIVYQKALKDFDPSYNVPFKSFLSQRFKGIFSARYRQNLPSGFRDPSKGKVVFVHLDDIDDDGTLTKEKIHMLEENVTEAIYSQHEEAKIIRTIVQALPFRLMTVMIGRYWWNLTLDQMAGEVELSKERMRQLINKSLEIIARALKYKRTHPKAYADDVFKAVVQRELESIFEEAA